MIRAGASQFARVLVGLGERYTPSELASGLKELLRQAGWSNRLPLITAALKYELADRVVVLELTEALPAGRETELREKITQTWPNRTVRIVINPQLQGGMRLRIDDRTLDYSLSRTLQQLQQTLMEV